MHTETIKAAPVPSVPHVTSGATMGARFSAVFYAPERLDLAELHLALQQAVDAVDGQMSTWTPDSDLMRLNRAPVHAWFDVPQQLAEVLAAALEIGQLSGGAFDIGVGDLVSAWGFGRADGVPDPGAIARARERQGKPAHLAIELDRTLSRVRKHSEITLDLSGIAKGYGVDELGRVLEAHGIAHYLASIDGEVRAGGGKLDGSPWRVAVERPEFGARHAEGVVEILDGALATSGDYRHFVDMAGRRYAHTMDPRRREPLRNGLAAVTVLAETCMRADAWATALMVLGPQRGPELAATLGLEALFAERSSTGGASATVAARQPILNTAKEKRL